MLRMLTAGESHGPTLVTIVEGFPAGLPIRGDLINQKLQERQKGFGRGHRMAIEQDTAEILSGVRGGKTIGSPIALQIKNKDWENWKKRPLLAQRVTRPRPGHADLAGALKYGHLDVRHVLERASARETAARVACGALAAQLLSPCGVRIIGYVVQIGEVAVGRNTGSASRFSARVRASPVRSPDPRVTPSMMETIRQAGKEGDTVGGLFEVLAMGVPVGLGSYVHWDRRLDGRLAQAVMSIQAIKGVEIGSGFHQASLKGSVVHDEIFFRKGKGFDRYTHRSGGLEGGVTTGGPLLIRAAMKPLSTLQKPLRSVEISTKKPALAAQERSDVCAVPAASVVGEAMVAWVLADAFLEKFGSDNLEDIMKGYRSYQKRVKS